MAEKAEAVVRKMPRRMAHALYALLVCNQDGVPSIASEIVIYDTEALTSRSTASALREASRRGLCGCARGVWFTTALAHELKPALEHRFLTETEGATDG